LETQWKKYELEITPEMIAGVEEYNDVLLSPSFVDDRGIFWNQEHADDYLPSLKSGLQIQWTYSKLCNFSCTHCFNGSNPGWKGFEADPFRVVDNMLTSRPYNVCLCGGEPFTWKPFYKVIEKMRAGGIPLVSTVTNGYVATPDNIRRAYESGLTNMQVSLDGINDEQFIELRGKKDGLARATAAVEECLKYEWSDLSVSFTPTRNNVGSWKEVCHYWAGRGITHIRTQPFMPIGTGAKAIGLMPTDEQYLRFHMDTTDLQAELPGCYVDWGDPLEHIWFYTRTAAHPWSYGIQTDGWYELSCYIPILLGNALEHPIEEFWAKDTKRLWNAPIVRRFASTLTNMAGMSELDVRIYEEESLHIDIFDDEQLDIFLTTDDLDVLRPLSEQNLARYKAKFS
jgi:MoaA/NifB/PqqE/SkfB family radical SAM enzyme